MDSKAKLNVVVGTAGTGKSYELIQQVVQVLKDNGSFYIMTPTHASKRRLVTGFQEEYHQGNITKSDLLAILSCVHVLHYQYHYSDNIFVDEFSMISIDDWYSLLYKIQIASKEHHNINITVYGDSKQLPPVHKASALNLLMKANYKNFKGVNSSNFNEYSATQLYDKLENMNLEVPDNWKFSIQSVHLTVLHRNYRLSKLDGVTDYNQSFYQYLLNNNIFTEENDIAYQNDLVELIKNKYLIIVPTHAIGKKVDELLSSAFTKMNLQVRNIAPFIRRNSEVYSNPNSEVEYGFESFIPSVSNDFSLDGFDYSFYTTVHSCQGATVDSIAFVTLNNDISSSVASFYNNNLLYTALSRARYNSIFLGKQAVIKQMMVTYLPDDVNYLNLALQQEAFELMCETMVSFSNGDGILSNQEILDLYHRLFNEIIKDNTQTIADMKLIDNSFEPRSLPDRNILRVLNPNFQNPYSDDLFRLGYDYKRYSDYLTSVTSIGGQIGDIEQKSKGGKIAGKVSPLQKWYNFLTTDEKNNVNHDAKSLSKRDFSRKYKHNRNNVRKLIN